MSREQWWGDFSFNELELRSWSIGERSFVIQRLVDEWKIWNIETQTELDSEIVLSDGQHIDLDGDKVAGRYLEKQTATTLRVAPRLADKSVVTRPASPVTILAGEKVKLFVTTPIWFSVTALLQKECLIDVPFWRPSDTWFGASTIDGDICYAKYTSARTRLEDLVMRSHRATTPITVKNNHNKAFTINRLNVPVNFLSLYSDMEHNLWTSGISIERNHDSAHVEVHIESSDLNESSENIQISDPRKASDQGKLIRRISNLFG